jgi:RiboL-PSP-HEPN
VELNTRRFTNANSERLQNLLGSFDPDWRQTLESFLVDELKDAVDSIVNLRNTIAHGGSVGLTYQRISDYYARVQRVVDRIAELCAPI